MPPHLSPLPGYLLPLTLPSPRRGEGWGEGDFWEGVYGWPV